MEEINVLAIDLAKASFQIHGNDKRGKCVVKKALNREKLEAFVGLQKPCIIAMEACGSAHFWAKIFLQMGHEVRLIAPQFVKPFVMGNKNDRNDAKAIAEAAVRPSMHFVAVKSAEQLDLQAVHRVRQRHVRSRTALCNEIRGFLFEHGITLSKNISSVKKMLIDIIHNNDYPDLPKSFRVTLTELHEELQDIEVRITRLEKRLEDFAKSNSTCNRLQSIPGIGLITSTAVVAAVADPKQFKNGRHFAAWAGLVPRHSGTGGSQNNRVGGISKKGDPYLRQLLVHGSRSVIRCVDRREDAGAAWIKRLRDKAGWNKASVALANKNARIIWAILNSETTFDIKKMAKAI
jgi:transposase